MTARRTGRLHGGTIVGVLFAAVLVVATGQASAGPTAPSMDRQLLPAGDARFTRVAGSTVDTGAETVIDPDTGNDGSTDPDGSTDAGTGTGTGELTSRDADQSILESPLGAPAEDQQGSTDAEDRKIWAVIGGLLLVAIALTVLTVRYWRQTRPAPRPSAGASSTGRRSRTGSEPTDYDDLGSDLFVDES